MSANAFGHLRLVGPGSISRLRSGLRRPAMHLAPLGRHSLTPEMLTHTFRREPLLGVVLVVLCGGLEDLCLA